jgi:hypothetical protein
MQPRGYIFNNMVLFNINKSYQNLCVYGIEDSENAISNDLETPYFQKFSARRQPWWRLVAWVPQNKISRMFFAKVGNYGIMHAACTDPRQCSHLVFLFLIDLTDYSLIHNIICPRFHVKLILKACQGQTKIIFPCFPGRICFLLFLGSITQ